MPRYGSISVALARALRPTHGILRVPRGARPLHLPPSDPPSPGQMSPYVVPDRAQPERKLQTTLTPTFWAALTIVPFDALAGDLTQSKMIPDGDVPAAPQVSVSSEESTSTQPSKLTEPPPVRHEYYFFDDGNVTFLVRPLHSDTSPQLTWTNNVHRSKAYSIAFMNISSAVTRVNSMVVFQSSPRSNPPGLLPLFLYVM